jgi:hypothetical protein
MELTKSLFDQHVGESFSLAQEGGSAAITLTLTEVSSPGERIVESAKKRGAREPFSILFRGPAEPLLPQQIQGLHHHELGRMDVFLVPIDRNDEGAYYEAVFN